MSEDHRGRAQTIASRGVLNNAAIHWMNSELEPLG